MSVITAKELLKELLVAVGVAEDHIALLEQHKKKLGLSKIYPWAAVISDTARFDAAEQRESQITANKGRLYKQFRCRVVQPLIVQIFDESEQECTAILENLIENLPYCWEYKGVEGSIEPIRCEYSDFYSVVVGCYESALLLEFGVDIGPAAQQGKKIQEIKMGEYDE